MRTGNQVKQSGLKLAAPRHVRVRPWLAVLILFAAAMVATLCLLGVASLFESSRLIWLDKTGVDTVGTVSALYYGNKRDITYDPDRVQQISAFEYRFTLPKGPTVTAVAPLELSRGVLDQHALVEPRGPVKPADKLPPPLHYLPGATLTVRYGSFAGHLVNRPWDKEPTGHMSFLMLSGLALVAIGAGIGYRVFGRFRHDYLLVRHGRISQGIVRSKKAESEDMVRYYITFSEFHEGKAAKAQKTTRVWTSRCSAQQFLDYAPDQKVTLIAPPDRPEETTLVQLLPFAS